MWILCIESPEMPKAVKPSTLWFMIWSSLWGKKPIKAALVVQSEKQMFVFVLMRLGHKSPFWIKEYLFLWGMTCRHFTVTAWSFTFRREFVWWQAERGALSLQMLLCWGLICAWIEPFQSPCLSGAAKGCWGTSNSSNRETLGFKNLSHSDLLSLT